MKSQGRNVHWTLSEEGLAGNATAFFWEVDTEPLILWTSVSRLQTSLRKYKHLVVDQSALGLSRMESHSAFTQLGFIKEGHLSHQQLLLHSGGTQGSSICKMGRATIICNRCSKTFRSLSNSWIWLEKWSNTHHTGPSAFDLASIPRLHLNVLSIPTLPFLFVLLAFLGVFVWF